MSKDLKKIEISIGTSSNLGKSKNTEMSLTKLAERFENPVITQEKFGAYKAASDKRQSDLKVVNGWFLRAPVAGRGIAYGI